MWAFLETPGAARVDSEKIFLVGFGAHAGHVLGAFRALPAAVKDKHDGERMLSVVARRNVYKIVPRAAIHLNRAGFLVFGGCGVKRDAAKQEESQQRKKPPPKPFWLREAWEAPRIKPKWKYGT